jgi:hypothetical protein
MARTPDHDPSVFREPHMRGTPLDLASGDRLDEEPVRAGPGGGLDDAESSARDEPSLAWRGDAMVGIAGYADHLAERERGTSPATRALVFTGLVLVAGPAAILCTLWSSLGLGGGLGYMAVTVTGPVVEEMAKVAIVLWLVERKPWLLGAPSPTRALEVSGTAAIIAAGLAGGLLFGAIENAIYLTVYFPDRGEELAAWRWAVTMPMHAICSTIAAVGVARMWRRVMTEREPARISHAFPWIVAAILMHGVYNAFAVLLSVTGLEPK